MGRLRIIASGKSSQAQANARGKLFEKLMTEVLRKYGYRIDRIPNVNYSGMEIDIEGKAFIADIPLYSECKCYETEITSEKIQSFFGKYMARWLANNKSQGLFIALPSLNSHAKAFYRDNCESNENITVRLLEEGDVLDAILGTEIIIRPEALKLPMQEELGMLGDWQLLYSDKGLFWAQYIILKGEGIPRRLAFFDAQGNLLSDKEMIDYLYHLCPDFDSFEPIIANNIANLHTNMQQDAEEIVEVIGSRACFEYQFPASPEFFVGRQDILKILDSFIASVLDRKTSSRGLLFEANSGWGKSSVVLESVSQLSKKGHFAVAIDSRSASSSQFMLKVVEYAFNKFDSFNGILPDSSSRTITGFEGAVKSFIEIGRKLESQNKLLFIFLDQFENVFYLHDALRRIRDLLMKVCDAQTNIVLGFSWKTDLIGETTEFPYRLRDDITGASKRISLGKFSEVETNALLRKLVQELKSRLRKDLEFFLSEFSQGYPWLLKKLCAHVKSQRQAGVSQLERVINFSPKEAMV